MIDLIICAMVCATAITCTMLVVATIRGKAELHHREIMAGRREW